MRIEKFSTSGQQTQFHWLWPMFVFAHPCIYNVLLTQGCSVKLWSSSARCNVVDNGCTNSHMFFRSSNKWRKKSSYHPIQYALLHVGLEVSEEHQDHIWAYSAFAMKLKPQEIIFITLPLFLDRICNVSLANYVLLWGNHHQHYVISYEVAHCLTQLYSFSGTLGNGCFLG